MVNWARRGMERCDGEGPPLEEGDGEKEKPYRTMLKTKVLT